VTFVTKEGAVCLILRDGPALFCFDRLEPAVVKGGGVGFAGICTDYACFAEVDHQGKGNQELDCRIVLLEVFRPILVGDRIRYPGQR